MVRSEQINEWATALCAAQAEMPNAAKDSVNLHFKSKYADFESVWGACGPYLTKHGLCTTQGGALLEGQWVLETTLTHNKSGQYMTHHYPILEGPRAQAFKSGFTYARRGGLEGAACIASEDDDGNEASKGQQPRPPLQAPRQVTTPVQRPTIPNKATHISQPGVPPGFGPKP